MQAQLHLGTQLPPALSALCPSHAPATGPLFLLVSNYRTPDDSSSQKSTLNKEQCRAFLVARWSRIPPPMQETQVWFLVWEDPTCSRVTKPVCHNYWACAPESRSRSCWSSHTLQAVLCRKRSRCNEKHTHCSQEQPPRATTREKPAHSNKTATAKNNYIHLNIF